MSVGQGRGERVCVWGSSGDSCDEGCESSIWMLCGVLWVSLMKEDERESFASHFLGSDDGCNSLKSCIRTMMSFVFTQWPSFSVW